MQIHRDAVNIRPAGVRASPCPAAVSWEIGTTVAVTTTTSPTRISRPAPTCRWNKALSLATPVARPGRRSSADRHSAAASEPLDGAAQLLRNPSAKNLLGYRRRRLTPVGELCLFSKNCGLCSRSLAYSSDCQAYLACPSLGVSAISRKSHERRAKTAIQRSGR